MTETKPAPNKPLTDPADLLRLLSRFMASLLLFTFAVVYLIKQDMGGAAGLGILALLMQAWTISLWRKLRDRRLAAKAERDAALEVNPQ